MIDLDLLPSRWTAWYPGAPPFAPDLRALFGERWLRIHSLPEAKRYADDEREYEELLARHERVATDLLGAGGDCMLLHVRFRSVELEGAPPLAAPLDPLPAVALGLVPALGWGVDEGPGGRVVADVYAAPVRWEPGVFTPLIREIADDAIDGIVFVAWETCRVYAPYDGGADLFFDSPGERERFRAKYAEWLSRRPDGL